MNRAWTKALFLIVLGASWGSASGGQGGSQGLMLRVPKEKRGETIGWRLKIDFDVRCSSGFPAIFGEVILPDRNLRFDLIEGKRQEQIVLGRLERGSWIPVRFTQFNTCQAIKLQFRIEPLWTSPEQHDPFRRLAVEYSPVLIIRGDQIENRVTDLPLILTYNWLRRENGHWLLRYTTYFSDEDSAPREEDAEAQMRRYGRRLDIEWVFEVEFSNDFHFLGSLYHGGIFHGLGHLAQPFHGEWLKNSHHPLLYNIATHNVFDDRNAHELDKLVAYHFLPLPGPSFPRAREEMILHHPWMIWWSDHELAFEKKLAADASKYNYFVIEGDRRNSEFSLGLEGSEASLENTFSNEALPGLGTDLWGKEQWLGFRTPEDLHNTNLTLRLKLHSQRHTPEIKRVRVFQLLRESHGYKANESTSDWECPLALGEWLCRQKKNAQIPVFSQND